jgi:hypothetical protein
MVARGQSIEAVKMPRTVAGMQKPGTIAGPGWWVDQQ